MGYLQKWVYRNQMRPHVKEVIQLLSQFEYPSAQISVSAHLHTRPLHLALKYGNMFVIKKSRTMFADGEFRVGDSRRLLVLNRSDNSPLSPIAQGCNYCPSSVKSPGLISLPPSAHLFSVTVNKWPERIQSSCGLLKGP